MPVEMICLKAYFKIYFTTNYLQLQIINGFIYGKMEIHHGNRDLYRTFKVGAWFIMICNLYNFFFAIS